MERLSEAREAIAGKGSRHCFLRLECHVNGESSGKRSEASSRTQEWAAL